MTHRVIMNSGRVYHIDFADKEYRSNWVYFKDELDNMIIGLSKANIEAEVYAGQDDMWEQEMLNSN